MDKEHHYKVEQFKTPAAMQRRANELFSRPGKPYYVYLFAEGPSGLTAVFAESRKPKPKE